MSPVVAPADHTAIDELRAHVAANGGIPDLDVLAPTDVDGVVEHVRRDGFALVADVLSPAQLRHLRTGVLEVVDEIVAADGDSTGNRGRGRYSFGAASVTHSMLHRPEWQMLIDLPTITPLIEAIFASSDYILRSASGDFCLPGTTDYQPLHADMRDWQSAEATPYSSFHDPAGAVSIRDLPCPYVCVNFLVQDQTSLNGPTRQIPGTQNSRDPIPSLDEEPEWMRLSTVAPAPAGAAMIRDVRAWHGGTPNLSDDLRAIPNVEYYAPWFREPMRTGISWADRQRLSPTAQRLTRWCVADSSEVLPSGYAVRPLPQRLRVRPE